MNTRATIAIEKAHATYDLRMLLIPWLQFKAVVTFKANPSYGTSAAVKKTFYGDEHSCTYKQCLAGHVDKIVLNRLKGYTALIDMVENINFKKSYVKVYFYGRSPQTGNFDILHRYYYEGKLSDQRVNDPVLDSINVEKNLDFKVSGNRLLLLDPTLLSEAVNDPHRIGDFLH
jgi:hypothetical protein